MNFFYTSNACYLFQSKFNSFYTQKSQAIDFGFNWIIFNNYIQSLYEPKVNTTQNL